MAKITDVNSFKEFERIPNPELINDDDLILIETEDGELKTVKYKDLGEGISKDGIIGDTGPQGPKGDSGVDIVGEDEEPDKDAVIWIKEGITPEEDLSNNIESYLSEFFKIGTEDPRFNPEITEKTMLYFKIDEDLPESNIRFVRVPNDESDMQKQIDALAQRVNKMPEVFVQSEGYDCDIDDCHPGPAGPDYMLPKVSISSTINYIEIGGTASPTISIVYNQNDGGSFKTYRLFINDKLVNISHNEVPSSFILDNHTFLKDMKVRVEVEYLEGPIKDDDDGPFDHVLEGYCHSEIMIKTGLPYWNLTDMVESIPTAEYFRNKEYNGINLKLNDKLNVRTSIETNSVIFAYPKHIGDCSEINYVGFDIYNKDVFDFIEIDIPTADNSTTIPYYVYYYIAPIVIGPATFILTV